MSVQPRRARKADANQAAIVAGLRALEIGVLVLNAEADLAVGYRGKTILLEVKRPDRRSPSRIQPSQKRLAETWPGAYAIVSTLDEALAVIGWEGKE